MGAVSVEQVQELAQEAVLGLGRGLEAGEDCVFGWLCGACRGGSGWWMVVVVSVRTGWAYALARKSLTPIIPVRQHSSVTPPAALAASYSGMVTSVETMVCTSAMGSGLIVLCVCGRGGEGYMQGE